MAPTGIGGGAPVAVLTGVTVLAVSLATYTVFVRRDRDQPFTPALIGGPPGSWP